MAFIRSKRAIIESEFDRNTVFFFYFSRKESFCIEARIAGGGKWKRDPGRRSHRTQDVSWTKEGRSDG